MTTLAKLPCTIITGFLGAGKTTLVRNLLQNANGRRIAVIVNEFGDVGIDGDILRNCGIENCSDDCVIELANGCLCCTVADDFVPVLKRLLEADEPPEHMVIETSGLALPKPLVQAFNWPEIASRVTVDGVVTMVDGAAVAAGRFADDPDAVARQRAEDTALDHDNPLEEVYEDQLLCADLVLLNKTDLMSEQDRCRVVAEIKAQVPSKVKIISVENGRIATHVLLGLGAAVEADVANRPSHHDLTGEHDHDDFDTFVIDLPDVETPDALTQRIADAAEAHDILRVKGFANVADKPMRLLIQGVGARIGSQFDRLWLEDEPRQGRLVVIGQKGLDEAAVRSAITG